MKDHWGYDNAKKPDIVEVVRCKDCKSMQIYGGYEDEDDFNTWWCEELEREIIDPLWFCKNGERRSECIEKI